MKLEKPIVLYDVEKEGLDRIIKEKEKYHLILSLGDSIPWKRNTKQIFLFYAEKMANLLPPKNRNRLKGVALSLFPTNDEVYGEESLFSPYHFALPFDDKYIVEESESEQDKEEWEKCKESDMPYLDTYYGRIYTDMLKPREILQSNKTNTIGEELIDIAESLVFSLRLHIRSMAWEIAEAPEGMKDALRLMDWFNEFSSSFMAEIGKIACGKNETEIKALLIDITNQQEKMENIENEKEALEKIIIQRNMEEEQKQEDRSELKLKDEPIWIKALCGNIKGFEKVLNYKLKRRSDGDYDLEFSFCSPKYNCGKLAERLIEDDKKIDSRFKEYKLRVEERGLETRLKKLSNRLNDGKFGDVTNRLITSLKIKKKAL